MDPFKIGHRTQQEMDTIRKIVLSRTKSSAPQTLVAGQFPNPPPMVIYSGVVPDGVKDTKTLKQALAALEVIADVQEYIERGDNRRWFLNAAMVKETGGPMGTCFETKGEKDWTSKKFSAKKQRKDLISYLTACTISVMGAESSVGFILNATDPNSPTLGDVVDTDLVPALESLYASIIQATNKVSDSRTPIPIQIRQNVGVVNRSLRSGSKTPNLKFDYNLKVHLLAIDMELASLQAFAKRDGSPTEQVDVAFSVLGQKYEFSPKTFEGVRDSYNSGLQILTGKSLDEYASMLVMEVETTAPPTKPKA